jgi:S-(hydroxymethyl)glutathione dehydrogenase/alcohol dehydrogenase
VRAAILEEYGENLVVEDVSPAPLDHFSARVRIDATGVCHSDLTIQSGDGYRPPLPLVIGHEAAGVVVEVGRGVSRVKPGDRVIASWCPQCDECFFCRRGQGFLCERRAEFSDPTRNAVVRADGTRANTAVGLGTFATHISTHESMLVPIESTLPTEYLALIGCGVTTGVFAVLNTAQVPAGAVVAVLGCGGVGLSVVQGARVARAARILAVDPVGDRRAAALAAGATDVLDPADGDTVEQLRAATDGRGADYVFEAGGRRDTYLQARAATIAGGMTVFVGGASMSADPIPFTMQELHQPGALVGCAYGSAHVRTDFPRLVRLVESGAVDLGGMVTKSLPLDGINEALDLLGRGEGIRTIITSS